MRLDTKDEVRKALIRGVLGSWSEWRSACILGLNNDWTEAEMSRILFWYHPSTWVFILLPVVLLLVITVKALWP
jgi:hypothetical protein